MPRHTHIPTHTHTHTHSSPTHPALSSSTHLCQYVCFVWMRQFILLTYFLHQKQSLQQLGKGLILCKCMQITVTQNSIRIGSMQIVFAKQAYWKGLHFPAPSHSTHPSALLPIHPPHPPLPPLALPYASLLIISPFAPPPVSLNPLSTLFSLLAGHSCPGPLSPVSPSTPTPPNSFSLPSSL